jgi:hypothetical protein
MADWWDNTIDCFGFMVQGLGFRSSWFVYASQADIWRLA